MEQDQLKELAEQLSHPSGEFGIKVAEMMHETNISMTRSAIATLKIKPSDTILEIGHGSGAHIKEVLSEAADLSYIGIEISELMHTAAKQFSKENNLDSQCFFMVYDGEHIPAVYNTFDAIFTVNTVYFWKDPRRFLEEIYRVLKKGGRLAIAYGQESFMSQLPFTAFGFTLYSSEKMQELIKNIPFKISEERHFTETVESKIGGLMEREYTVLVLEKSDPEFNTDKSTSQQIILYISDQKRSRDFYSSLLQKMPKLDVPGICEFEISPGLILGLMPENGMAKIIGNSLPHPGSGSGIPRCELYLRCTNARQAHQHALTCGAKEISEAAERDWGDIVGYSADPDGHILAFAE